MAMRAKVVAMISQMVLEGGERLDGRPRLMICLLAQQGVEGKS